MALVYSLLLEDFSSVELKDTRDLPENHRLLHQYFCGNSTCTVEIQTLSTNESAYSNRMTKPPIRVLGFRHRRMSSHRNHSSLSPGFSTISTSSSSTTSCSPTSTAPFAIL